MQRRRNGWGRGALAVSAALGLLALVRIVPSSGAEPEAGDVSGPQPATAAEPAGADAQAPSAEPSAAPRSRTIEEIVVTAQRREEQLHDVPVSMSAFDERFLRQQGVTDLQDVARYVPNVRIDLAGTQIQPRIRGFSTNTALNRALELPVGIVVDEVPYSRADYFQSGLFDLDRVEVLRGPQGQLFGANTTVGLLNLTTKKPTDEYTGFINTQFGELNSRRFEGGVGGPLPLLRGVANFRLAALSDEQDGYMRNTTKLVVPEADEILGGRLRRSVRAKLDFPNILGGSLLLTYQRDHQDIGPTPRELTFVPNKFRALLRQYDPNFDAGRPSGRNWPIELVGSVDTPSFRRADMDTFAARGSYDLGGWGLNAVAGWSRLDSLETDDADSAPWRATTAFADEASRQMTFELRVTSPDLAGFFGFGKVLGLALGSTDFTSGFFFQRRTQSPTHTKSNVDAAIVLLSTVLNMQPDCDPQDPTNQCLPIPRPPPKLEFFDTRFEQTADELAGFGQMNWRFIDRWTLIYGMRLDSTRKNASWDQTTGPPGAVLIPQSFDSFTQQDSQNEFHFAPKIGMKFDPTRDVDFYWNWSHNFQSGGFNNVSSSADPATRRIKPALVQSWEAGTKTRLLDGAAELNFGLFWMMMKDFQLFTIGTPPGKTLPVTQVLNVGRLRARGVEADSTWLPTDWLTLRGALGFNDATYLEFPIGNCMQDRQNTDGDSDSRCDLKGRPLEQAPHWDASVTPSIRLPLTSIPGLGAILPSFLREVDVMQALSVQWTDNRYLNDTDDPRTRQPSYFFLDGSVGFGSTSQGWSLLFRVDNLTDVRVANTAYEAYPMGGGVFRAPLPPRLMYGGFSWQF